MLLIGLSRISSARSAAQRMRDPPFSSPFQGEPAAAGSPHGVDGSCRLRPHETMPPIRARGGGGKRAQGPPLAVNDHHDHIKKTAQK